MQPTILEAAPQSGGLAASQSIGGYTWDRFYHVILLSDRHLLALLDELGLASRLHWGVTRTGFYTDDTLYSMSDSLEFLRFPPLGLVDKARLAGTILYASRVKDWRPLESISVSEWLIRLSGRRTFERIWLPLLKSKLGDNYKNASAAFIWAIIARLYAARRSGLKREMFGYVEGGYDTILRRFRERLDATGVEMVCGQPVTAIHDVGGEAEVCLQGGERRLFDKVVLTISCPRVAAVCPQLSDAERERLNRVVYQGIICGSMLVRKPLANYYVTNITDAWVPFTAVIEMTSLVDRERFDGLSLVYLPRYVTQSDRAWLASDQELWEENLRALERMYPHFDRGDVVATQMSRVRDMLAVSTLGYSDHLLPPLATSLPNVYVANSAQIANGTLNVEETVTLANQQAEALRSHFRAGVPARA
jgi:protoporphyrinogen oxidase